MSVEQFVARLASEGLALEYDPTWRQLYVYRAGVLWWSFAGDRTGGVIWN